MHYEFIHEVENVDSTINDENCNDFHSLKTSLETRPIVRCKFPSRFVDQLPSNWVFVLYCVLLRMTEGVGSAMFVTATFTVLPVLFPKSVATIMVSGGRGGGGAEGGGKGGGWRGKGGGKEGTVCMSSPNINGVSAIFLFCACRDCLKWLGAWDLHWDHL